MEKIMIAVASSSLSRQRRGGIGFRSENPAPKKHHLIQSAPYCLRAYVEFLIQFYVLNLTGREPRAENSTCSRKVYCLLHTNDTSTVVLRSVLCSVVPVVGTTLCTSRAYVLPVLRESAQHPSMVPQRSNASSVGFQKRDRQIMNPCLSQANRVPMRFALKLQPRHWITNYANAILVQKRSRRKMNPHLSEARVPMRFAHQPQPSQWITNYVNAILVKKGKS